MATIAEIRQWAKDNNMLQEGGRLTSEIRIAYEKANESEGSVPVEIVVEKAPIKEETRPRTLKKESLQDKFKGVVSGKKTSVSSKPRVSVEGLISGAWQLFAQIARPINTPVAKVLNMQAPVAGMLLEDTIKDTVVDKILQPFARVGKGGETLFALMGPPALVAALTTKPELAPAIIPMLRRSLMLWMQIAGPKIEEMKKKEEEFTREYGESVDSLIAMFLMDSENG